MTEPIPRAEYEAHKASCGLSFEQLRAAVTNSHAELSRQMSTGFLEMNKLLLTGNGKPGMLVQQELNTKAIDSIRKFAWMIIGAVVLSVVPAILVLFGIKP